VRRFAATGKPALGGAVAAKHAGLRSDAGRVQEGGAGEGRTSASNKSRQSIAAGPPNAPYGVTRLAVAVSGTGGDSSSHMTALPTQ
jgi:hypothetical protein